MATTMTFYTTDKTGVLSNLTTTDKTTLVNAINELDTRTTTLETSVAGLAWTLAGTATGSSLVTYPSTAKELYVAVYCNGQVHTAYVIPSVSSGAKLLVGGYCYNSSDYGLVNCDWSASNHTLNLRNAIYAGTDYKASSTLYVYYR